MIFVTENSNCQVFYLLSSEIATPGIKGEIEAEELIEG